MLVSRVSPAVNNSNIVPTKVNTKRTGANPSFGIILDQDAGRLIREELSELDRYCFRQMFDRIERIFKSDSDDFVRWSDAVWEKMLERAQQLHEWRRAKFEDPTIPMPISMKLFSWDWESIGEKKAA